MPQGVVSRMFALDSPRWSELTHAYGVAHDTSDLLRRLRDLPVAEGQSETWFSLWSSLAHQGDAYTASFAVVPYVVEALTSAPDSASATYFQFPAWVEICRKNPAVAVPQDLEAAYFAALARLPALAGAAAVQV